ncbi:lantibiotic dehydratase family protein [Micromonospora sp. NBC_01699]|uniref:lantibiotic dehydratase n=1 Tax=Micromonospora sp. NBC_01699 TaxID=2975984 RepID=UPI002E2CB2AE|nr:lantibiotic dehydratase [Micromonospora sp. NBC_01699]
MSATHDPTLGPLFVLRVAGLPVTAVRRLRSPTTSEWADEVLRREHRLAARGAELSEALHGLVKANEDELSRRRLLTLRRQVFQNVLPADPAGAVELVGSADDPVASRLSGWLRDRRELAELRDAGAAVLADELARNRDELRLLVDEPRLRLGLLVASPVLAGQLRELPAGDGARDKRARRLERSVLSYLYRTACKTSPFSTFTAVGLGRFTTEPTTPVESTTTAGPTTTAEGDRIDLPGAWTSRVRLNVVVLGRLVELVMADPGRRADLPVELTAGWRHDDDRIRYVRHWVTTGDDDAPVSFDSIRDRLFFLRRSGLLDRLIGLFAERPALRCGDLLRWLADEQGAAPQECERYLSALLDLGMLQVRCLRTDVHTPDPLRALRDALRDVDRPWATGLAGRLDGLVRYLDRYPAADVETRRRLLADLRADLGEIARDLGAPAAPIPQALLYEDVAVDGGPARLDLDRWERLIGPGLAAVERILPAFDPILAHRLTLKGFFVARFGVGGRCDDVLKLVEDFHEDLYRQYVSYTADRRPYDEHGAYLPEENWLGLPGITALDDARQLFAGHLRTLHAGHPPGADLHLDDRVVAEVAARLEPLRGPFVAQSHFVQLVAREPDPLVVLNQSYGGLSFPFSRFTHCFGPDLADRLRRHARLVAPEGAVLAEVTGGAASTNLNLHGRLVDHEIVNPGETSCAPPERQLPLGDLTVTHDVGADRLVLRSRRLGREVIPLYFGYLIPVALPEIARTLLLLSPASTGHLDVWAGVPAGEAHAGVTTRPRVRYGHVVLSRRSWHAYAAELPIRVPGTPEHEWFLGWRRWRLTHALPRQVFVTVHQPGGATGRPAKPQYLDFDSVLSLVALEGLVKTRQARLVLREMLPAEDQLHVHSDLGTHVAELAVQTQRRIG